MTFKNIALKIRKRGLIAILNITNGLISVNLNANGDIKRIMAGDIAINQFSVSTLDVPAGGIFLRLGGEVFSLLGGFAQEFSVDKNGNNIIWRGKAGKVSYKVVMYLTCNNENTKNLWFFEIELKNEGRPVKFDLIYAQDLGLATEGHISSNEAYNSQYIDHKAFYNPNFEGYTICSRQNQAQNGKNPFVQLGCFDGAKAFSVDGYPFFGLEYKFNNQIADLSRTNLNNRLYQYEFAYLALQNKKNILEDRAKITFYGMFLPDLPHRILTPQPLPASVTCNIKKDKYRTWLKTNEYITNKVFCSESFLKEEINEFYPERLHEEYIDGKLLSFFVPTGEHVVLGEKERHIERSHGHIIASYSNDPLAGNVFTSTSYIYGVFNSHIAFGNTSFNKLDTNCRNGLNVQKASGQRIMLKIDGVERLLTMPAVYEMGFNYARWLYKIDGDILEIISYIDDGTNKPILKLQAFSHKKRSYDFRLYHVFVDGIKIKISKKNTKRIRLVYEKNTLTANLCPELEFEISGTLFSDGAITLSNWEGENAIASQFSASEFEIIIKATKNKNGKFPVAVLDFEEAKSLYRRKLLNGINNFYIESDNAQAKKLNAIIPWFAHNARVHFASPHGLEQFGGAAWGTRDVCQGPMEFFLALGDYETCRLILRAVYSRQLIETGDWPQWFMFDEYLSIAHNHSHGDIIFWPLKALAAYLRATKDYSFLETRLPYNQGSKLTDLEESFFSHIERQITAISKGFLKHVNLPMYGGGDWDDTLQPARPELAKNMTSGWTCALAYQVLNEAADAFEAYGSIFANKLRKLAKVIREDFDIHVIKDGVAAGFVIFNENDPEEEPKYLLHPSDTETGISYRLLPAKRGIISGIFSKYEAEEHLELIRENLVFPDGVRLINKPPKYRGGETQNFMRAETSASFLREISLQYLHAHIRYMEALATMGKSSELWKATQKVNPVLLREEVPNAAPRQSNAYFSSSDADFENRYDAYEKFEELREGKIAVKGGWRVYSSGSGIFLSQLIRNVFGLREEGGSLVIDPVLPIKLDGLVLRFKLGGKNLRVKYNIKSEGVAVAVNQVKINGEATEFERLSAHYREGGVSISASALKENCLLEVFVN